MKLLPQVSSLLQNQGFVIVSTLDARGRIHCAAKGVVGIEPEGKVYLIDLYRAKTFSNISRNPLISITAVDEQQFTGFTVMGKARIIEREKIENRIVKAWEERVAARISKRVIDNIKKAKKGTHHPEVLFPPPQYLIEVEAEKVVDLTPSHLKPRFRKRNNKT